jgi:RNA polymerase sigma-70 factor (ECF subfamily)
MSIFATPGSDESGAPEPEAPFGDRPDERVIRAEQIRAVKSSLTQLRQQCRDIIDLHYREELKYREIAEKLNISIGTVASRLARCLDDLGGSLEIL